MSGPWASCPDFVLELVAGSVGGLLSEVFDYPFDTAKVLLQTQQQQQKPSSSTTTTTTTTCLKYKNTLHCMQISIQENGVLSLYKGMSAQLVGGMAANALHFWSYSVIKREILLGKQQQQLSFGDLSLAAAGSGAVMCLVTTPVELVKCRLQVSAQLTVPLYRNSWDCVVQIIREEGFFRGLYKGNLSTLLREVPGSICWYLTYEVVCEGFAQLLFRQKEQQQQTVLARDNLPVLCHLVGGASAGTVYWAAIYPIDTVKTILQTTRQPLLQQMSFPRAFLTIYQQGGGIQFLYRGFLATILRAAPADALLFAGYEQTLRLLKK